MRRCLLVLVVACSTPPSRPTPTPEPSTPATRTCELTGRWRDQPDQLRMSPQGAAFATVFGVEQATVVLGESVQASLETPTLVLAGYVDPTQIQLHARRPFVVGEIAVPGPAFPMRYLGARGDRIALDMTLPGVTTSRSLRSEHGCSELAIDERRFDPQTAIRGDVLVRTSLQPGIAIPLAISADGPAVAELRYDSSPRADVIAWSDAKARVVVHDDSLDPARDVLVFGWIPRSALLRVEQGTGGSWARGGARSPISPRPSKHRRVVCDNPVALHVRRDRDVRVAGTIKPKTVIELLDDNDPVEVALVRAHAELADGAHWLVERAELAGCTTPP